MADTTAGSLRRDVQVVGLVSGGHFMSHYFVMILPPLFPFLHSDLGVSYTLLGLLLSLKNLSTGTMQMPAGILVDRYGARLLLLTGFGLMIACFFVISLSTSFWILAAMFLLAGVGNSVFHPANYSILNGTINEIRIGRSFSAHTFSGNLGDALAPAIILTIAAVWNWRVGVLASCILALAILLAMLSQWNRITEQSPTGKMEGGATPPPPTETGDGSTTWAAVRQILVSKPMLLLFLFFALQALGSGGFRNFAVAGLVTLHDTPAAAAGGALTGFLFASAFGVLVGGVVADKNKRHELIAGGALLFTAFVAVLVGSVNLHYAMLVFVFTLAGLVQGMIRPARDMMIRAASPKGSIGKAFGFVFSGQAVGGTVAPVLYGFTIDIGNPALVFYSSAFFMVMCMLAVVGSAHQARKEDAARASARS